MVPKTTATKNETFCQQIGHLLHKPRFRTNAQKLRARERRVQAKCAQDNLALKKWVFKYGSRRGLSPSTIGTIQSILVSNYGSLFALFCIEITQGGIDVPMLYRNEEEFELIALLGGMSETRTESKMADFVLEWMEISIEKWKKKEEREKMGLWERAKDKGGKVLGRWGLVKREWNRMVLKWEG